ncbi:MAG: ankyrin repeat domain-containing protein [Blastocatellales bacterium]
MSSENQRDFFEAVKTGDRDKVHELIKQDAEMVNARHEANVSAVLVAMYCRQTELAQELSELKELDICEAVAVGNIARVKKLLEENPALANEFSPDGFPVLGYAAFFGHLETLKVLLEARADPNHQAKNPLKVCPIHSALAFPDEAVALAMTESLLAAGADASARQQAGWTALHAAAAHGSIELINLLIRYDADRNAKNDDGKTPADLAKEKGHTAAAKLLQT